MATRLLAFLACTTLLVLLRTPGEPPGQRPSSRALRTATHPL